MERLRQLRSHAFTKVIGVKGGIAGWFNSKLKKSKKSQVRNSPSTSHDETEQKLRPLVAPQWP
jgi:uncharacterized protein YfaP (DUF2135 family)